MRKFKIGIIGCGAIYKMHAGAISESDNLEIAAICDIDFEKAKKEAEKHSCLAFSDY